jgi:3' exoribonuclease, RNase T-like
MNYFFDTEFLEGTQKRRILGFKVGNTKPTIDLISIGIVCEDGREYYAISKDFNLKEVWNRVQITTHSNEPPQYWHRNNVLFPIYTSYVHGDGRNSIDFSYSTMKWLISVYGKSNITIANEISEFIYGISEDNLTLLSPLELAQKYEHRDELKKPIFYGYYSAYDWVVFCQLHGIMMDLPKGYPFYCIDLKQILDETEQKLKDENGYVQQIAEPLIALHPSIKDFGTYPKKQVVEHHALYDARWIKELHGFLFSLR